MPEARSPILTVRGVAVYVALAAALFALAAFGKLRPFPLFAWVGGPLWAISGWLRLRHHRRGAPLLAPGLVVAGSLLALAAPFAHTAASRAWERALEAEVIAAVRAGGLPELSHAFVANPPAEGWAWDGTAGRLTVINFWATWCGPCLSELPMLGRFAEEHAGERLAVLGLTRLYESSDAGDAATRAELAEIGRVLQDRGADYPSLVARDGLAHAAFRVEALPTTLLIGPAGEMLAYGVGVGGTRRVLERARSELGERAPAP